MSDDLISVVSDRMGTASSTSIYDVLYPTGFFNVDYLNGYKINGYHTDGSKFSYDAFGIVDGSFNLVVGRTGSGKTTAAIQWGANIIRRFDNARMFIASIEGGITINRLEALTGWFGDDLFKRVSIRNSGLNVESIYKEILSIYDAKMANKDEYLYDTGHVDSRGLPIIKMVPTVYVIDSVANMVPERVANRGEMGGQMDATAIAKANTQFIKLTMQLLKTVNIIVLAINHINKRVETGFMPTKNDIPYLKQDETLPGGKAINYDANNIFKLDDKKIKEESFGFNGKEIVVQMIKSRTNKANMTTPLLLNFDIGFDPYFSLLLLLKDTGRVKAKGAYMQIDDYADMKFTNKKFTEMLFSNKEFQKVFFDVAKEECRKLLTPTKTLTESVDNTLSNDVMALFRAMDQVEE